MLGTSKELPKQNQCHLDRNCSLPAFVAGNDCFEDSERRWKTRPLGLQSVLQIVFLHAPLSMAYLLRLLPAFAAHVDVLLWTAEYCVPAARLVRSVPTKRPSWPTKRPFPDRRCGHEYSSDAYKCYIRQHFRVREQLQASYMFHALSCLGEELTID